MGNRRIPEDSAAAVRTLGSIVIAAADPSFVHKCASDSFSCQRVELWAYVGESEGAERKGSGVGNQIVLEGQPDSVGVRG